MPSLENPKTPTKRKFLEKKKNHVQDFLKVVDMMFLSFKILILDCVLVFFCIKESLTLSESQKKYSNEI